MESGDIVYLFFDIIVSFSGISFNIFTSAVSYRTWLSHGLHHPQGLLLFCLGLSCAIFEGYQLFIIISPYIWPVELLSLTVCTVYIRSLFTFCTFFNLCQVSWLCGFYCITLVSFQHRIFQVLKSRLPSVLPWIIAGTLVISGMVLVTLLGVIFLSVPVDNSDNNTFYCRRIKDTYNNYIFVILKTFDLMISLPFCLILVSLSCTVSTLVRHMRRVQGTLSLDRSHLDAHLHAVTTMILLLALNVSFYVSILLMDSNVLPDPWSWVFTVIYFLFYPLQALTFIYRTKKLYSCFICCLYRRSSEEM